MAQSTAAQSVSLVTVRAVDPRRLSALPGVKDLKPDGERARFTTTDPNRTLAELLMFLDAERIEIAELHVERATLEDVFLELTGTDLRD
jgi:hypothetical protein